MFTLIFIKENILNCGSKSEEIGFQNARDQTLCCTRLLHSEDRVEVNCIIISEQMEISNMK